VTQLNGTWDTNGMGRGTGKWEGEAPAEPKTAANSEWRIVGVAISHDGGERRCWVGSKTVGGKGRLSVW